ncbi:DNA polymerase III, chi subunit [Parasphingorhabdus marina DSM 22363]|uniref:DNA polymerase III, chi subunit n=1 Tax=Parasphingorhabdus marina DSM 22363 TaxID=1123272 RepID=A0A1N6GHY5_9SPHN|nr:DNA polymerase III subunit chi [Parasphingorhabdus marina]SIO07071.1 DNA polymerase III, chi subunit [Parasphingorhabdus marina DSM 22363]
MARQVDFYHLTRDPVEKLVPVLAEKTLGGGQRLLLVSANDEQVQQLSAALWDAGPGSFLAHNFSGCEAEKNQPILVSSDCRPGNGAKFVLLADGIWRDEALQFDRTFYLFSGQEISAARDAWRALSARENVTPRYWKQDNGRWLEGP